MHRVWKTSVIAMMLALLLPVMAAAKPVPDVALSEFIGSLAAEKGKVIVVNFFATWCPPCMQEVPELISARAALPKDKVQFFGVSVDENPGALAAYVNKTPFNYPVIRAKEDLIEAFAIQEIPRLLIYDQNSELVINHVGVADHDQLVEVVTELLEKQ